MESRSAESGASTTKPLNVPTEDAHVTSPLRRRMLQFAALTSATAIAQKLGFETKPVEIGKDVADAAIRTGQAGVDVLEAGNRIYKNREEIEDVLRFWYERGAPKLTDSYMPKNPLEILPDNQADTVYDNLNLEQRFPKTLDKDSFRTVSQNIAQLASIYYKPDKSHDEQSQETGFYEYTKEFFQKLSNTCDDLQVDFAATLLMWQVSGTNTSSAKGLRADIWDERIRTGLDLVKHVRGKASGTMVVNIFRQMEEVVARMPGVKLEPWYYAMPRVEGPVSMGIHDIETIMITRGLQDLETSLPEKWPEISQTLSTLAPQFSDQYKSYTQLYNQFDLHADELAAEVRSSSDIQNYLRHFLTREQITQFLTDGKELDPYQLTRTTLLWAKLAEKDALIPTGGYQTIRKVVEKDNALDETIDLYLEMDNPAGFFMDQIGNPKMLSQLQSDASSGNSVAQRLLEKYQALHQETEVVIVADRDMATALAEDTVEGSTDFQMLTGVAYTRWLLRDVYQRTEGTAPQKITYTSPHMLAYHAFLATANREAGPSYSLAMQRPLTSASLTFLPFNESYQTINDLITNVYSKYESVHPKEDFKTFGRYFLQLYKAPFFRRLTGTDEYLLEDNMRMGEFIDESKDAGVYRNLITPPHSSWMRSLEATLGYIAEITKTKKPA